MTLFVVTGPPAGGKSTWVLEHISTGSTDVIIEYDQIVKALTWFDVSADPAGQPKHLAEIAVAARAAAVNEAIEQHDRQSEPWNLFVVHATPSRQHLNLYRKHGAEFVECDPGYDECMRRAELERTPRQQAFVRDWYQRRGLTV